MAGKGSAKGERRGGRQKGTPNRTSLGVVDQLAALGCDPIENLARFAQGKPIKAMVDGVRMDVIPTPDQQLAANKELAQYVAPKRKAVEHTTAGGEPITGITVSLVSPKHGK